LRGELDGGEHTYQRAIDLATDRDGGSRRWFVGWALIGLGEIARLRGNLEEALELFREGMESSSDWLDLNAFYASLGLAHALLARGRQKEAWESLRVAEQAARRFSIPMYFERLVQAHRLLLLLRCGRLRYRRKTS